MKKGKVFLKLALKYSHWLILSVLATYVMVKATVMGTDIIAKSIDHLVSGGNVNVYAFLPEIFVIILFATIAAYLKTWFGGKYSIHIQRTFKSEAADKIVCLEYKYFDKESSGGIIAKFISDIHQVETLFSSTIPRLIVSTISIGTVLVYILHLNLILTLSILTSYPVVLIVTYFLGRKLKNIAKKRRGKIDEMTDIANDCISGIVVLRSYNLVQIMRGRLDSAINAILKSEYSRAWIIHTSQTLERFIFWIPNMLCPSLALYMVIKGKLSIGGMTSYIVLMNKILGDMKGLPFAINEARENNVSLQRLEDIFNAPQEHSGTYRITTDEVSTSTNAIKMENITFSYNEDKERKVFENLSITIIKGKTTAIVGESGQGKSTLFKIIAGFYIQQSGKYQLFGNDFSEWNLEAARNQLAIVSQNVFLFEGTIAENVAYGKRNATMPEIVEACKKANIHDFIMTLQKGYDTNAGERGVKLSGGECQRISIARAILKDAPILLMDEPTSCVDVDTEQLIQNAIDNLSKQKTVIIIAHRLSTIKKADKIMVIDKGKLVEEGTHNELLYIKGIYSALYSRENNGGFEYEKKSSIC